LSLAQKLKRMGFNKKYDYLNFVPIEWCYNASPCLRDMQKELSDKAKKVLKKEEISFEDLTKCYEIREELGKFLARLIYTCVVLGQWGMNKESIKRAPTLEDLIKLEVPSIKELFD